MSETEEGIYYRQEPGKGTPVIFIHGWLGSVNSWDAVRKELDIENPLIFYDQRCHGRSNCSEFDMGELSEDLENLIEELGLEDPVLVGHSMGGMTALKYSSVNENFSGLFLLGTCLATPEPENQGPKFFLENLGEMDRRDWAEKITDNYTTSKTSQRIRNASTEELVEASEPVLKYGLQAMIDYDVKNAIPDSKPSLVMGGTEDQAITREKILELSEALGSEYRFLDSSHLMLHEKPGTIAETLQEFLTEKIQ